MKTISKNTRNFTLFLGIVMATLIIFTFNAEANTDIDSLRNEKRKTQLAEIEAQLEEQFNQETYELIPMDLHLFHREVKILDIQGNLVYDTCIMKDADLKDEKLVRLLAQSDLIMTMDNVSFYTLSK